MELTPTSDRIELPRSRSVRSVSAPPKSAAAPDVRSSDRPTIPLAEHISGCEMCGASRLAKAQRAKPQSRTLWLGERATHCRLKLPGPKLLAGYRRGASAI